MFPVNENLKDDLAWLNGRPLFASISGGKDSTALGLFFLERGLRFTPLFIETGWEHPETYSYIKEVLEPLFGAFLIVKNEKLFKEDDEWKGGMEQIIKSNRMFPSGFAKFCTRHLKIIPVQNFYSDIRASMKTKPINAVGIRAEESSKRSQLEELEEQDEATVWRPLISFKEEEVIKIHQKHKVDPNPLYIKGASRVGCYPCIYARKHEIRYMSFTDPERIDYLEKLEERVNLLRKEEETRATFFKSRRKDKAPMGIRDIVEWSRQDYGVSLDDQEEIEEQGCMRWGFCEAPKPSQKSIFDLIKEL